MYTKAEVFKKAEEVNEISLRYHLSHATFACNVLLQEKMEENLKAKMDEITEKRKKAMRDKDNAKFDELTQEFGRLSVKKRHHIFVEYLGLEDEGSFSARTVCVDNQLVIYLPKELLNKSIKDGKYTPQVADLRKKTAHELGHALLHTDELLKLNSTQGSRHFSGRPEEQEANWFSEKLLELRHKRNKKMREDGSTDKYF